MDQQVPQTAGRPAPPSTDTPMSESVAVLAEGLLSLTRAERLELDEVITPRVATLMAKAFGRDFYELLSPLTRNDGPDGKPQNAGPNAPGGEPPLGDPRSGRNPDEERLRRLMRDPRYWRDKDPAVLNQVSEGFRRLYG